MANKRKKQQEEMERLEALYGDWLIAIESEQHAGASQKAHLILDKTPELIGNHSERILKDVIKYGAQSSLENILKHMKEQNWKNWPGLHKPFLILGDLELLAEDLAFRSHRREMGLMLRNAREAFLGLMLRERAELEEAISSPSVSEGLKKNVRL